MTYDFVDEAVVSRLTDKEINDTKKYIIEDIFKRLSPDVGKYVEDYLNSLTKLELVNAMINPINLYGRQMQEPKGPAMNKIVKSEGIIISEHVYHPYKANVKDENGVLQPVRSAYTAVIIPSYIRKNQQISNKEAKSATSENQADILGQASGSDRVGTFSDSEWNVCLQHSLYNTIKELNGPAATDLGSKKVYRQELLAKGSVSLKDLPDNVESKRSVLYLDQMLKFMGIDSDLVEMPE